MSWFAVLMLVVGLSIGYNVGWLKAHSTIATECQVVGFILCWK